MSQSDFNRLEWAISDLIEGEPIRIEIAAARSVGFAPIVGVILTDVYADEPGSGVGGRIVPQVVDMIHEAGWSVYLTPESPRAKAFFERHGFSVCKMRFGQWMRNLAPVMEEA